MQPADEILGQLGWDQEFQMAMDMSREIMVNSSMIVERYVEARGWSTRQVFVNGAYQADMSFDEAVLRVSNGEQFRMLPL